MASYRSAPAHRMQAHGGPHRPSAASCGKGNAQLMSALRRPLLAAHNRMMGRQSRPVEPHSADALYSIVGAILAAPAGRCRGPGRVTVLLPAAVRSGLRRRRRRGSGPVLVPPGVPRGRLRRCAPAASAARRPSVMPNGDSTTRCGRSCSGCTAAQRVVAPPVARRGPGGQALTRVSTVTQSMPVPPVGVPRTERRG
jgi:hypothetical protein